MAAGALSLKNINMQQGDILKIDVEQSTITLNNENVLHLLDAGFVFFTLASGGNEIKITGDDALNVVSMKTFWHNRWI